MSDKKNILCYDTASMPKSWLLKRVIHLYKEDGLVIWCSSKNGNLGGKNIESPPQIFNRDEIKEFKFIDTADLTEEQINELKGNE